MLGVYFTWQIATPPLNTQRCCRFLLASLWLIYREAFWLFELNTYNPTGARNTNWLNTIVLKHSNESLACWARASFVAWSVEGGSSGSALCSQSPLFPRPYVPQSLVPKALCSQEPMFLRHYVTQTNIVDNRTMRKGALFQGPHVLKVLCSQGPLHLKPYVPKALCCMSPKLIWFKMGR